MDVRWGDTTQPTRVMGIVNVTPDSFFDGGRFATTDRAVAHGLLLAEQGACIIDVGGESTRPGADPVEPADELARVLPVVSALVAHGVTVSIDTRHATTAARAIEAGAAVINDVTGLADPAMRDVAAAAGVAVVINHMPTDDPRTMQAHAHYVDVIAMVHAFLARRIDECRRAGISEIIVDPGIGFGKTTEHNLMLLANLDRFADLGRPILVGASRKRFIGELGGGLDTDQRLAGSIAASLAAVEHGAAIVRVHDVAEHVHALRVWHAIATAGRTRNLGT
jgi:dihydropteroate synthase